MLPCNTSHQCQVFGCDSSVTDVVMYSVKRSRDREKYLRWIKILKLTSPKSSIFACQRHFPAGAPTKNHPDPDPELFNPIPNILLEDDSKVSAAFVHDPESIHSPPPGTILKLAPNATLIDLKKLKEQDFSKPFRIEEVTVMIDEKDTVKVVDYGPVVDHINFSMNFKNSKFHKKRKSLIPNLPICIDHEASIESFISNIDESTFDHLHDASLGNVLENMRQLHIDCNTVIVDITKKYAVYAHKTILISRSPYFFKQLFLKRKKGRKLYQFCELTLPTAVDYNVVDAVVSYIYTGSLLYLLKHNSKDVKKLLILLEMKTTLELYEQEIIQETRLCGDSNRNLKKEKDNADASEGVFLLPCFDGSEERTSVIEVGEDKDGDKKRRRKLDSDSRNEVILVKDDYFGKLKVSVQKIVDNALIPFLGKIEELFDPSGTTLNIAKTSQHIITLWHADILLTKLFDQSELTKFFSDVMSELLEKNANLVINENVLQSKFHNAEDDLHSGSYTIESLGTQTDNCLIDDSYTKPASSDITDSGGTVTVDNTDMQIFNYQHIPKYVHMIAMYRFNIFMKKKDMKQSPTSCHKDALMPSLLEGETMNENASAAMEEEVVIEDLVNHMVENDDLLNNFGLNKLTESFFQQVTIDLKQRVVADLELYINPSFHEELIMHIIVDQMNHKNILPLTIGIFLAKGCNFCRKKECKSEDLTMPITSDNPVCPDRDCIRQNLNCFICHKQMSTSKSLARHKYGVHDIQTGDTSALPVFICSHCGETFSKKWKLNMHERDHEDRKMELACRFCKKKIRGSMALKKHISMVHEAKAQYSCEFCPKAFKRRETLGVHRRIHTREKPFRCSYCDYASETKGNLKAHVLRKHKRQFLPNSDAHQTHIDIANENDAISYQDGDHPLGDHQSMAATIVAQSLASGSFIIASENSPPSIEP